MENIRSFDNSLFSKLLEPPMAHVSAVIGHYILFIGGYRVFYENDSRTIVTFDKNHFLYYNLLCHELKIIDCQYDKESIGSFPTDFFCASGMASACVENRVYLFGGYSLSKQESGNALYYIEVNRNFYVQNENIDIKEVSNSVPNAVLKFICGSCDEMDEAVHINYPSYRDKCSLVHWNRKLFVFGGYGSNFRKLQNGNPSEIGHEFLAQNGIYISGSGNRGWTNQLLVFCLQQEEWSNPATYGNVPWPRAAHSAAVVNRKMFIFGGRLGLQDTTATVRSNECFYLDLLFYQWTKVELTGAEVIGRSWSTLTAISNNEFFIVGGFSGENVPLADAFVIKVNFNENSALVTQKSNCMHQAIWNPCMNSDNWNLQETHQPVSRMWHSSCLGPDGRVYIVGGCQNNLIYHVERIQTVMESVVACPQSLYKIALWSLFRYIYNYQSYQNQRCSGISCSFLISSNAIPNPIFNDLIKLAL